jgi:hypothetical protein
MTLRCRRTYDHRIREQIVRSGIQTCFRSWRSRTALSWIRRGLGDVVSLDDEEREPALRVRMVNLERRIAMLTAVLRLTLALLRASGYELERARVPDAATKRRLLSAIGRARKAMPLAAALRVLRLSSARYYAWVRAADACTLDDRPSCPHFMVQHLTYSEVATIGDMVQSSEHRHMSIRGLALHAQRVGKVFAHPATWSKLIRERGWRRPRFRLYPAKPKVGLRTQAPNEAWHLHVTIIKHQWLFLNPLDNIVTVKKLVAFYVTEHNEPLPHSAFEGQTPDEVYFGRGAQVPDELAARRHAARRERVERNRSAACSACPRAALVSNDGVAA